MERSLDIVLESFRPIGLAETGKVRLMNRIDTKYVTDESSLIEFLRSASSRFRVVEIGGRRNMAYSTCYYDTPDCNMYYEHERGRAARQKIRVREYRDTGAMFLEIKRKNNHGRTDKRRVALPCGPVAGPRGDGSTGNLGDGGPGDTGFEPFPDRLTDYSDFIAAKSRYSAGDLVPRMRNRFRRITLVDNSMTERLTIDTGLVFTNLRTGLVRDLAPLAVIELKRDGNVRSETAAALHSLHIHPSGFSKYCIGMALTDPAMRRNNLKPRIRMIRKILENAI